MCLFNLFKKSIKRKIITVETREKVQRDWKNVEILLSQKGPSQLRQALITADKSLDNALKDIFDGETMGERLKNAESFFERDQYNRIWEAHKVRNNLVHESGYEPPYFVVTKAVQDLKEGLEKLGVRV
ncbi:MAG TPA: hypothetical protein P5014_01205 [Patescibacteria group bacterium]|nr:hypothetical protein [bacterium]HRY56760.1 hypothetical protein [Patescibacteria group bacterium]